MRVVGLLAGLDLVLGSLVFAAPVAAGDPCYHGFDVPARSEGTEAQIKLMPCAFAPTVTRVAPGTTVEFFSGPDFVHLLTGANQEWGSRDEEIPPDSVVAYRFDNAGIYPFACALHRGMSGTIVVGNGVAVSGSADAKPAVVMVSSPEPAGAGSGAHAATSSPSVAAIVAAPRAVTAAPAAAAAETGTTAPAASTSESIAAAALIALLVVVAFAALAALRRRGGVSAARG